MKNINLPGRPLEKNRINLPGRLFFKKNINLPGRLTKKNKINLPSVEKIIIYLVVIYTVGIVGMLVEATRPIFIFLAPINIIGAIAIILLYHQNWNKRFILSSIIIFIGGFIIEWIGVKTGLIFGQYEYGQGLGFKLAGVPPIMGLNWFLLVYGAGTVLSRISNKKWLVALLGAGLMVVYDIFLEPAAIEFNFWKWTDDKVPMQNYLAWFISAFVFIYFFIRCTPGVKYTCAVSIKQHNKNPVAEAIFWLQLAFFGCIWAVII